MSDMTPTIVPKSDQMNADDLIAGPITIKVTGVTIKSGEQPVSIHYEGDNGKPYKCCKSMARILVASWGADSKAYVGRSMTLYRDPDVKWAGMAVGGIRISHLSDIEESMTMALTMTRSNRKPFTVKPLDTSKVNAAHPAQPTSALPSEAPDDAALINRRQIAELETLMESRKVDKAEFLKVSRIDSIDQLAAARFAGAKSWIIGQGNAQK